MSVRDLKVQFKNSMLIIEQIKNDEWEFSGGYPFDFKSGFTCYTASRDGVTLWVANGAYGCRIENKPWVLGIFGVLVWLFAAQSRVYKLESEKKRRPHEL